MTTVIDGRRVEASATILATAKYGLPSTADQDTYLAILKLATDQRRATGLVENPIPFSSAEILRLQGKADSGRNYAELQDQLMRMTTTTVESQGAVFLANGRRYARDAFHLLDRVVLIGSELDGRTAEQNYVWLSQWQLQNLNANYFFPVDYDTYRQLRNPIAKALVPLLQVWLYASRAARTFEKRYDELTEILHVTRYAHPSKVREKLGPALDELVQHEYLTAWRVEPTADRRSLKLVFTHGRRFASLREPELGEGRGDHQQLNPSLLHALTSRGIAERKAQELLTTSSPGQDILRQLEWGDSQIAAEPTKFRNPPGFYVHLIETNVSVPETFQTSAQRAQRHQERRTAAAERERDHRSRQAYEEYCFRRASEYLNDLPPDERRSHLERAKTEIRNDHPRLVLSEQDLVAAAERLAIDRLLKERIPIVSSFKEFCKQRQPDS